MKLLFVLIAMIIGVCACSNNSSPSGSNLPLEYKRRVAILRQTYQQLLLAYNKDGVLKLPQEINDMSATVTLHSSLSWDVLHHNPQPISMNDDAKMHIVLLYDSADLGDGTKRLLLFADGHVEVSTWIPIE